MLTSTPVLKSVNGVVFKQPTDFGVERYDLTKSGRVASGKMTIDIIAKKIKFTLAYEVLSGPQLTVIRNAIDTMQAFFPVVYVENGIESTVTVYRGAIKYRRFRTDGIWYWKDVAFDLIEQ